jgi:hypothetical protein
VRNGMRIKPDLPNFPSDGDGDGSSR